MLSPQSQLLLRNAELFETGHWLIVNANDGDIFKALDEGDTTGFFQYFDQFQNINDNTKSQPQFGAFYQGNQKLDGVVVYMPKSKEQLQMLLANIAPHLNLHANILLVGENKSGIKSSPKLLQPYSRNTIKIDSARHCSLYATTLEERVKPFNPDDWVKYITININEQQLELCSLPGVFNHKQLDEATRLLLHEIKHVPSGSVLDFGCGTGVIGTFLAKTNPSAKVTMTDVNAIALYCAEKTAEANNVKANVVASNGVSHLQGKFSGIYTNPPFHTGIKTDYSVTENFLHQLPQYMQSGAEIKLVANSFLPYQPLIEKYINKATVLTATTKFKVYQSRFK
jgi:16S rRNA (guanine1207-N2)-methyltransferase